MSNQPNKLLINLGFCHSFGHRCPSKHIRDTMLGKLAVFLVGVYAGVFADQHYQLPRVDNPQDIWDKVKEFAEKYRKD